MSTGNRCARGVARSHALRAAGLERRQTPPESGWDDVTLPDDWSKRWPKFDGVVWYRLIWNQQTPLDDTALFLEYLTLAGEIRVNGALLSNATTSLVEPAFRGCGTCRATGGCRHRCCTKARTRCSCARRVSPSSPGPGLSGARVGQALRACRRGRLRRRAAALRSEGLGIIGMSDGMTVGLFFLVLWLAAAARGGVWLVRRHISSRGFRFAWNHDGCKSVAVCSSYRMRYQNLTEIAAAVFSLACLGDVRAALLPNGAGHGAKWPCGQYCCSHRCGIVLRTDGKQRCARPDGASRLVARQRR